MAGAGDTPGIMIVARNILHHYGYRSILRGLSFEVARGELVAVMGPNGAGKSTLLGLVTGALWPLEGTLEIDGFLRRSSERAELEIRRKLVYLPDHPWIPSEATGHEFLAIIGELYSIPPRRIIEHIPQLLELFQLDDQALIAISKYSNGQKKKIAIAAALMTDAKILVLDEPFTGGLDPEGMHVLKAVLGQLARDEDRTVLIASQIPEIVARIADQVLILRDADSLESKTMADLRKETAESETVADTISKMVSPECVAALDSYLKRS